MRTRTQLLGRALLAGALACGFRPEDAAATPSAAAQFPGAVENSTAATPAALAIDRYLPIVSRMPFGVPLPPPVAAPAPESMPGARASDLGKNCVLSVLVRSPAGDILVGFTDQAAQPPRNLLLAVGETADGYEVRGADLDRETVTLAKDGVCFDLRLTAGLRALPAVPSAGGDLRGSQLGAIRLSAASWTQPPVGGAAVAAPTPPASESPDVLEASRATGRVREAYAARVRERRERLVKLNEETQLRRDQMAPAQPPAAAAGEEAVRRRREANLNLIRKGLKPLESITLTPEEDAGLVAEGVLPAP